jgi:hypothetical protein
MPIMFDSLNAINHATDKILSGRNKTRARKRADIALIYV